MIHPREHCIPAYDELVRVRRVSPIPAEIEEMEEKTAGGIVRKVRAVVESEYFEQLPPTAVIKSGAIENYQWNKEEARKEMLRIWNECKKYLQD